MSALWQVEKRLGRRWVIMGFYGVFAEAQSAADEVFGPKSRVILCRRNQQTGSRHRGWPRVQVH